MENKIIKVKQDLNWYCAKSLLESFHSWGLKSDEKFAELLKELEDYVESHLEVPFGVDIIETYVVRECEYWSAEVYEEFIKNNPPSGGNSQT